MATLDEETADRYYADVIEAVTGFASQSATLAYNYFCSVGYRKKRSPTPASPQLLLEVAAIMQIATWEQAGLRHLIADELPEAAEALALLVQRIREAPKAYLQSNSGDELSHRVLRTFLTRFSRSAYTELNVDMAVVGSLDQSALESLADFLWEHRHLLEQDE
jgi:hypothetical protein